MDFQTHVDDGVESTIKEIYSARSTYIKVLLMILQNITLAACKSNKISQLFLCG